jgi:hypothetical protein
LLISFCIAELITIFVLQVHWNARGQPVGKESQNFVSYIGVIVRRMVPISMENWRAPEMRPYKQKVLDEIRVKHKLKLVENLSLCLSIYIW